VEISGPPKVPENWKLAGFLLFKNVRPEKRDVRNSTCTKFSMTRLAGVFILVASNYNWMEPGTYFDLFHRFSVYLFKKGVS
jgi:hypothetical protein